jgi:hypothetical protein
MQVCNDWVNYCARADYTEVDCADLCEKWLMSMLEEVSNNVSVLCHFLQSLIMPLCSGVENELRIRLHTHLQLNERNPLVDAFETANISHTQHILRLPPMVLGSQLIDIKSSVTSFAST